MPFSLDNKKGFTIELNRTESDLTFTLRLDVLYITGTTWAYDNVSQVESSNSCTIRRGRNGGADFYSVNNFVTGFFGPSSSAAETINEKEFLKTRIQTCKNVMKSDPNFINVDYWQKGDLVEVAMEENIARANARRM